MPTTAHSRLMDGYVALEDSTVAARLRQAGAVTLGKLNTHEFAAGSMELWGYARNPWDTDRVPGGSSSGLAVALAAHLTALALGSDTGGSVRIPGSFSGVVGLKPTYGLVSRAGILPLSWSLDGAGPMARTVGDVALLLGAIAGQDRRDRTTVERGVPDYHAALKADLHGVRLGIPEQYFFESLDPEVERNVRAAIALMQELGATVRGVSLPHAPLAPAASWAVAFPESYAIHRANLFKRPHDYGAVLRRKMAVGAFFTAEEIVIGQRIREIVTDEFRAAFANVDAIVTPTTQFPAFPIAQHVAREIDVSLLTRPVSLAGLPAAAVPVGFTDEGLPTSMQIIGGPWGEATVLGVGHAYERAAGWYHRRPPLRPGGVPVAGNTPSAQQRTATSSPPSGIDAEWVTSYARLAGLSFLSEGDAQAVAALLGPLKETLAAAGEQLPPDAEPALRPAPTM